MLRPPAEFKKVWDEMNDAEPRTKSKQVCSQNRDVSYNPFCTNVGICSGSAANRLHARSASPQGGGLTRSKSASMLHPRQVRF